VAVPSRPDDAAGLFWSAIWGDDPTLILLPKRRFGLRQPVEAWEPVPFGRARCLRSGTDVTVVTWGNGVELAEAAADELAADGMSLELLDLRSLAPCDWTAIRESVGRTGRLVVVQEDTRTSSFGSHILAELTRTDDDLALHLAAPQLVSREDVSIPYGGEQAVLPAVANVVCAVRTMLE
jgi:2-oxoisovalerate dehydrogenase E1 component